MYVDIFYFWLHSILLKTHTLRMVKYQKNLLLMTKGNRLHTAQKLFGNMEWYGIHVYIKKSCSVC